MISLDVLDPCGPSLAQILVKPGQAKLVQGVPSQWTKPNKTVTIVVVMD